MPRLTRPFWPRPAGTGFHHRRCTWSEVADDRRNGDSACRAAWRIGSCAMSALDQKPRLRLISFKPLRKNSLRGFANLELPNGLRISDCPVLVSNGKAWATLPSKPVLDRDGKQVEVESKRRYCALIEWKSRELADGFSQAVVTL